MDSSGIDICVGGFILIEKIYRDVFLKLDEKVVWGLISAVVVVNIIAWVYE